MGKAKKLAAVASLQTAADALTAQASEDAQSWARVLHGGANVHADNREVDVALVQSLLASRWACKGRKDYKGADVAAAGLKDLGVIYVDERREWYTRKGYTPPATTTTTIAADTVITATPPAPPTDQADVAKPSKGSKADRKPSAKPKTQPPQVNVHASDEEAAEEGQSGGGTKRRRDSKRKRGGDEPPADARELARRDRQRALQEEARRKQANGTYVKQKRPRTGRDNRSRPPATIPKGRSYPSMD